MAVNLTDTERRRSWLVNFFWPNQQPDRDVVNLTTFARKHEAFLRNVEKSRFNWVVFAVAASGFFTDSYNLFASNVIIPALAYVYWSDQPYEAPVNALAFNIATLGASAVGQLVFGLLADMFGRRSLYGWELIIVIFSTVGLLQSSVGFSDGPEHTTWNVTIWVILWRTIMGFGVGAEYPLSACIAAEWSSTPSRGRMMSAVFLMQPLGQLCAYGAGLTALIYWNSTQVDMDKLWRYVVGIGTIPTVVALLFRISMPESGRFTYDVLGNHDRKPLEMTRSASDLPTAAEDSKDDELSPDLLEQSESEWKQFAPREVWAYLYHEGHWVYLAGTSLCWFLLDFAFYGLGFNNPSILAKIWTSQPQNTPPGAPIPWWLHTSSVQLNDTAPAGGSYNSLIHEVLYTNMTHAIYAVSIPAILGSIAIISFVNMLDRKTTLTTTFGFLGVVLIALAGSFDKLFHQGELHVVLLVFWVAISFLFSFGPNTLTFVIPAEVFPTKYRCSFYGVAAASGKIGALLVQIIVYETGITEDPNKSDIRWLLLALGFCMLLGGLCSHLTLPKVQAREASPPYRLVNIKLEDLPPPPPQWALPRRRVRQQDPETG